jgi:N-acetylneuraminic acid mutarotase
MFQQEQVTFENPSSWRIGKLTSLLSLMLLLAGVSPRLAAQGNEWTWMSGSDYTVRNPSGVYGTKGVPAPGNVPGARDRSISWTDSSGNFWLFGGYGYDANGTGDILNDLWRYTQSTGEWTWMSGSNTGGQLPGVYGTKGVPAASNVPGTRGSAVSWMDSSGNLWLFGGYGWAPNGGFGELNDLWKYTPSTGEWTWMSGSNAVNQPGVYGTKGVPAASNVPDSRYQAASWMDSSGNLWLFGGNGYDANRPSVFSGILNDLWKYTPSTGEWTWMSGSNSSSSAVGQGGVYGTKGAPAAGNVPGARAGAVGWMDSGGDLWIFGGGGYVPDNSRNKLNDLWKYTPSTGEWTWMSGSNTVNQPGVYGTKGVTAPINVPGARDTALSWTDSSGNLWLFGGDGYDVIGGFGYLNDLWKYTPSSGDWTWISGSNSSADQPGVYGTKGVPAPGNVPGGHASAVSWMDSSGNLWLFGGDGYVANGGSAYLNDLWKYTPAPIIAPSLTTPAPGSTLSGSTVTFGWNPGAGPTRFLLRLGTTASGSSDVYSGAATTGTSAQVSGIPANGAYLYARLWYYLEGMWKYTDARYTEAGTPTPPAFTTPAPGSTLPGSTVTFGWGPGKGATRFVLRLGTTFKGSTDVYSGPSTTGTSVQLTTIPTNGAKLYARLWYYLNETWKYVDATYTEASQ